MITPMQVDRADERDSSWEEHRPRFRVYLFEGGDLPGHPWSSDTYDIRDADILEAISWAQERAGDVRLFAVACVRRARRRRPQLTRCAA